VVEGEAEVVISDANEVALADCRDDEMLVVVVVAVVVVLLPSDKD
jgi:hypothetical protein